MTEPRTAAGRALLADFPNFYATDRTKALILAIEAEMEQATNAAWNAQENKSWQYVGAEHAHDPDKCDECQEMVMEALRD